MTILWLPIAIRAVSTACVVVFAARLAEIAGPFWGALVASLPVSAGPAYFFLAMQHDDSFVAASALNSFAGNAATGIFLIVYALTAQRSASWAGLGLAVLAWCAASLVIRQIAWTAGTALGVNLAVYAVGFLILRPGAPRVAMPAVAPLRRWNDLPLRAASVGAFVSGVVLASLYLGPQATGIVAVFPISLASVLIVLRPRIGGTAAALLAATALRAMLGFGLGFLALHLAIGPWGMAMGLSVALCVPLAWSAGIILADRWRARRLRACVGVAP